MACKKCGGGTVTPISAEQAAELRATGEMVLMEYIGSQEQKRRMKSKVRPSEQYVFGGGQKQFLAYRGDVEWLTAMATQFKRAEVNLAENPVVSDVPVLVSDMKPMVLTDLPIDALTIDPITLGLLRQVYSTVNEVRNAGRAEWMTIKHIGATRADAIQEALDALQK